MRRSAPDSAGRPPERSSPPRLREPRKAPRSHESLRLRRKSSSRRVRGRQSQRRGEPGSSFGSAAFLFVLSIGPLSPGKAFSLGPKSRERSDGIPRASASVQLGTSARLRKRRIVPRPPLSFLAILLPCENATSRIGNSSFAKHLSRYSGRGDERLARAFPLGYGRFHHREHRRNLRELVYTE